MSDMKASVTLELIEKGFEKADKAAKSLDKLAKSAKKADKARDGTSRGGDRAARNAERAARAEEKHAQAIHRSSEAMRRQKNETMALERQQRRLEQTQMRAALKAEQLNRRDTNGRFAAGPLANRYGGKLGGLGLAFAGGMGLGIGAGAGAIAAGTVKGAAADEWERDQLRVLGNISEAQMKVYQKQLELSGARRGVGTQGAYGVFGGLMAGGLSDKDAADMTDSVLVFAKATKAGAEDATSTTVALRNNMGITADKLTSAYDAIALGGKAGQFEVEDMAKSLPSLLAKMGKLGEYGETGVRNTVAMAQAIRKTVGSSDEAATNFENMLDKFTSPDFVDNAGKMGINVEQTMKDAKKKGLSPAFAILQKIAKATKGDPFKISKLVPDRQAAAAIASVLGDMDFVLALIKDMDNSSGTVMNDFTTATANANEAWSRFAANITNKAKNVAEQTLPAVTKAMNQLSDAMEGLAADERSYAQILAEPKPSEVDFDPNVVKDETRKSVNGKLMEGLLGIKPGEQTRKREMYDDPWVAGAKRATEAARKKAADEVDARIRAIIPAPNDFTDPGRDMPAGKDEPVSYTPREASASVPGWRPDMLPPIAPVPTARPGLDKAMAETGRKAEAEAKNTAGSIENILKSMDTYAAGLKAGNQLAAGLRASKGDAAAAAGEVASSVAGHFPQSPAKVGPLRKLPEMGRKISAQLAGGMDQGGPARAASRVASGIMGEGATVAKQAGTASGGGRQIIVNMGGISITGVSDPQAAADHVGEAVRRRLDGVMGDVGFG